MKRTIVVSAVLVALAVLVAPALAAPSQSQLQKITWRGAGVTGDYLPPSYLSDIIGAQVKFDGVANEMYSPDSMIWSGHGTFADRKSNIQANLAIDSVTFLSENQMHITGDAVVTANGVKYSYQPFELNLDRSSSEFLLVIEQNSGDVWCWWIPGSAVKGSIRIA